MIRYTDINTGNNYLDEALENYLMYGFQPGWIQILQLRLGVDSTTCSCYR